MGLIEVTKLPLGDLLLLQWNYLFLSINMYFFVREHTTELAVHNSWSKLWSFCFIVNAFSLLLFSSIFASRSPTPSDPFQKKKVSSTLTKRMCMPVGSSAKKTCWLMLYPGRPAARLGSSFCAQRPRPGYSFRHPNPWSQWRPYIE